jgi:hypothetical protein
MRALLQFYLSAEVKDLFPYRIVLDGNNFMKELKDLIAMGLIIWVSDRELAVNPDRREEAQLLANL